MRKLIQCQYITALGAMLIVLGPVLVWAHGSDRHDGGKPAMVGPAPVHDLPRHLKKRVKKEMDRRHEAMEEILDAMLSLEHGEVVIQARTLQNDSLLKHGLTEADRATLHQQLPEEFRKLDRATDNAATNLIEAAGNRDTPGSVRAYEQILQQCTQCHIQYGGGHFKTGGTR